MHLSDNQLSLHFLEKVGLCNLYELQKLQNPLNCQESVELYINYLFKIRASYCAIFLMKNCNFYNNHAAEVTLENAISIGAKVRYKLFETNLT